MRPLAAECQPVPVHCAGRTWILQRAGDMETLWDSFSEEDFGTDERMPYWAELWPASVLLGEWIQAHAGELERTLCLDLGCGLGLASVIASSAGARVVAVDYEWPAVYCARQAMRANGVDFHPVQMDWRAPAFRAGVFPLIFGGDILYEERFVEPVAELLQRALSPTGRAWFAGPERSPSRYAWERLPELGFSVDALASKVIDWKGHPVNVFLREVRRLAQDGSEPEE
jgi:ETFB lysine methyltransferase